MPSDLDALLDMGFERARAEIAVKKSGGRKFLLGEPHHVQELTLTIYPLQYKEPFSGLKTIKINLLKRFKLPLPTKVKMTTRTRLRRRSPRLSRDKLAPSFAMNAANVSETRTWQASTPRRRTAPDAYISTYLACSQSFCLGSIRTSLSQQRR